MVSEILFQKYGFRNIVSEILFQKYCFRNIVSEIQFQKYCFQKYCFRNIVSEILLQKYGFRNIVLEIWFQKYCFRMRAKRGRLPLPQPSLSLNPPFRSVLLDYPTDAKSSKFLFEVTWAFFLEGALYVTMCQYWPSSVVSCSLSPSYKCNNQMWGFVNVQPQSRKGLPCSYKTF